MCALWKVDNKRNSLILVRSFSLFAIFTVFSLFTHYVLLMLILLPLFCANTEFTFHAARVLGELNLFDFFLPVYFILSLQLR